MAHWQRVLMFAVAVALASPSLWALLQVQLGAAPVGYGQPDGSVQPALLGPRSPWPDWALVPEGARLHVKAWFGPGSSAPENGFGELRVGADPAATATRYAEALEAEGWRVERMLFVTSTPERQLRSCVLRAIRSDGDGRVIQASFEYAPVPGRGSLHWSMQPRPTWAMPSSGPC